MLIRTPVSVYRQAVQDAYNRFLAGRGFTLKKEHGGVLVAQSTACRIIFSPHLFVLFAQRTPSDPKEILPAYDLGLLLEAIGSEIDLEFAPLNSPDAVMMEVERMVGLLVEECGPVLDGNDAVWQRIRELDKEKEDQALARLGEAGLRLKEGDDWRELPELESVRTQNANKVVHTLLALVLLLIPGGYTVFLLVAYATILFGPPQADAGITALVLTGFGIPMVLLDIYIVKRLLLCQFYWETSEIGITVGGYLKKRFTPWSEIDSAMIMPGTGYEFQTSQKTIRLNKEALNSVCLEASIWQHLTRYGKADSIILSPLAMSFWAQIPEEKTEEIHWENPKPAHALDILLRLVFWEVLFWGLAFRYQLDVVSGFLVVVAWPVFWALFTSIIIKRVSVLNDGIEAATALGKLNIPWKSVRSVKFFDRWYTQPATLQLRAGALGFIRIPWYPEHPNSTRVMLAILRRLRQEERFKFLPFPAILLLAAYGESLDPDVTE